MHGDQTAAAVMFRGVRTIDWRDGRVVIVDQTLLPAQLRTVELTSVDDLVDAIARLPVRGAPALGAAGALGVVLAVDQADREGWDDGRLAGELARVRAARPTAVNLSRGMDRVASRLAQGRQAVLQEALAVLDEDVAANRSIGSAAGVLGDLLAGTSAATQAIRVHTRCNTGSLATVEFGTALGVLRVLHQRRQLGRVYVGETRPLLQGSRLTAWELDRLGIDYRVVVDGAGPTVIARGLVDTYPLAPVPAGRDPHRRGPQTARRSPAHPRVGSSHRCWPTSPCPCWMNTSPPSTRRWVRHGHAPSTGALVVRS